MTGLKFSVCKSRYKEDMNRPLKPRSLARYLSRKKAEAVAEKYRNSLIIAADTFIVIQERILGKPKGPKDAERMLTMLSGKAHAVITGFSILDTGSSRLVSRSVETKVYFRKIAREEIGAYIGTKEPLDKAGAYAIQGLGAVFINKIDGDFFNVVGLPLCALAESLKEFGVSVLKQSISAKEQKCIRKG